MTGHAYISGTPYKAGTIWETESRKGKLTIELCEDVDMSVDDFFDGTIVEGRAQYASAGNRAAQRAAGMGTKGDTIGFRTSLTRFIKHRPDLEAQVEAERAKWKAGKS
jgi:hypothetical protein